MSDKKPYRNTENLPEATAQAISNNQFQSEGLQGSGINNEFIPEPVPQFNQAGSEVVYKNNNNSWIVLGRDRPAGRASGYGGGGASGAGAVDICVGRMSGAKSGPSTNTFVDPNFKSDAARIYISQKTDIDKNFELPRGNVGLSTARSGIGIKADAVRIIGREGIKLVTGVGTRETNSQGKKVELVKGIDLIAGNDDESGNADLQPMVKGSSLVQAMKDMNERIDELNAIVYNFLDTQIKYNLIISSHTHLTPTGIPTVPPDTALLASGIWYGARQFIGSYIPTYPNKINIMLDEFNNLQPFGANWICSRYNRVN